MVKSLEYHNRWATRLIIGVSVALALGAASIVLDLTGHGRASLVTWIACIAILLPTVILIGRKSREFERDWIEPDWIEPS